LVSDDFTLALVKRHESCRLKAYWDVNAYACGWGIHGADITPLTEWTQAEADARLLLELGHCEADLASLFGKATPDGVRLSALIDCRFNVGESGFIKFHRMIIAVRSGDWQMASHEMLNSEAAVELPSRYHENAGILSSGIPPAWYSGIT
jgi:GH24 family phage-related lysozyme (muramidase)